MFLHKKVALSVLCFVQILLAQTPIQGVVQDAETGAPIIGVNILLVSTETGTVTDVEGLFTLEKPADIEPILRLSHIAYNTMEILIDSSYTGVIQLDPAVIKGQEIEVVGVKSKTEMDVASSVDMLDIAEIEIQGARDLGSALRRVSSVKMDYSSSGKQTISIRGSNATDVAVFLDGVRLNDDELPPLIT